MKKLLYLFFFIGTLTTCSEVIDLDTDEQGGELVIYGRISNSTYGNYVEVSLTSELGQAPTPVSGAIVKVIDQNGIEEQLKETEPGRYDFEGKILTPDFGDQFHLEINTSGELYTSLPQTIQPIVAQDELSWETGVDVDISDEGVRTETEVVRVFVSSVLDQLPEEFYIRWTLEEAYVHLGSDLPSNHFPFFSQPVCYVTKDLTQQRVILLNGLDIRNTVLGERKLVSRRIDRSFAGKHYFNLIQSSINQETHEYWSRVNGLIDRSGSIFDVPPAPIPSNIVSSNPSEKVLGHFEVIGVDTARVFLTNNDIPLFFLDPCAIDTPAKYRKVRTVPPMCASCLVEEKILPQECIFCSLLPGYSSQRPSYF